MSSANRGLWESLEAWCPILFLIAGASLFVHVVLVGLIGYAGSPISEGYHAVFGLAGLVGAIGGLLGFSHMVADEARRLALASALAVGVAGALFSVILLWLLGTILLTGGPQDAAPSWVGVLAPLAIVMIALGFVLSSIASLKTDVPSRTIGLLLLVPVASWIVILGVSAVTNFSAPYSLDFFANGTISVSWLAIGFSLQTGSTTLEHGDTSLDSAR